MLVVFLTIVYCSFYILIDEEPRLLKQRELMKRIRKEIYERFGLFPGSQSINNDGSYERGTSWLLLPFTFVCFHIILGIAFLLDGLFRTSLIVLSVAVLFSYGIKKESPKLLRNLARLTMLQHILVLSFSPWKDESDWRRVLITRTFSNVIFFEQLDEGFFQFLILTLLLGIKTQWGTNLPNIVLLMMNSYYILVRRSSNLHLLYIQQ